MKIRCRKWGNEEMGNGKWEIGDEGRRGGKMRQRQERQGEEEGT
jgi:hypothetical protein